MKKSLLNFLKKYKYLLLSIFTIIIVVLLIINYVYPKIRTNLLNNEDWLRKNISIKINQGLGSNIYSVEKPDDVDIFTETYQQIITGKIEQLLENYDYTFEDPLIILNPYGTNNTGINIYYNDENNAALSYTVEAKDTENFSRTLTKSDGPDYEYQLIGLVGGRTNTINLTLTQDDQVLKTKKITINMSNSESTVDTKLDIENGDSTEELTDGLYALLGHDKSFNSNIYLYDNNGVLRSELALRSYRTDRIVFKDNYMIYSYKKNGFVKVDNTGKIIDFYNIKGYTMHHDFVYDEINNKLVILANKNGANTIEDYVITLNLDTKEVEELLDMKDYLKDYYDNAVTPEEGNTYGGDELDWVHLNSLQIINGQDVLLSAREISFIIRINDVYENPTLKYILADESMVAEANYEEYSYTKVGDFTSHAGQHTVTYTEDGSLSDGQYYVTIYNNNYGGARTKPDFDWSNYPGVGTYEEGTTSMFYKYLVDETKKTYTLVQSFNVPYSSIVSSIEYYNGNIVTSSGKDHSFGEYDSQGNLIRQFNYTSKKYAYRAFKYDFNSIWFQN